MRSADTALQVEKELADLLSVGTWKPGERLPEARLARQLGVSRTPVREAVRRLVSAGVLEQLPNQAPRVRTSPPEELAQLYDLRIELEGFAAERAATDASPRQKRILLKAAEDFQKLLKSAIEDKLSDELIFKQLIGIEVHFHNSLNQAANNSWLAHMLTQTDLLSAVYLRVGRFKLDLPIHQALRRTYERHHHLATLINTGKAKEARAYSNEILQETREREVAHLINESGTGK
ncbi:GntR family transcriptional regulator [bacterium AH-315-E10]|nr:GntR family transcriptional regulator [bacterium AH-315-E10]